MRDWLYVDDHSRAIWEIMREGRAGQSYNIGGENEWENIRLVRELIDSVARAMGRRAEDSNGSSPM